MMRLSEAILLGMMHSTPGRGPLKHRAPDTRCVVEATLEAVGQPAQIWAGGELCTNYGGIERVWPWTRTLMEHPHVKDFYQPVSMLLWSLFDGLTDRGMSSKEIAEWVKTIEPAEPMENMTTREEAHNAGYARVV